MLLKDKDKCSKQSTSSKLHVGIPCPDVSPGGVKKKKKGMHCQGDKHFTLLKHPDSVHPENGDEVGRNVSR